MGFRTAARSGAARSLRRHELCVLSLSSDVAERVAFVGRALPDLGYAGISQSDLASLASGQFRGVDLGLLAAADRAGSLFDRLFADWADFLTREFVDKEKRKLAVDCFEILSATRRFVASGKPPEARQEGHVPFAPLVAFVTGLKRPRRSAIDPPQIADGDNDARPDQHA